MPYTENEGVRIYYETDGKGPPLVMGHGGSDNLGMWQTYSYRDALKENYQLVLIDFRGHGRSDKPHRVEDYGPKMADDVIYVLDSLGIFKTSYMGYSLGATVGYTLAARYPERFSGFILGGVTPYEWPEEMVLAVNIVIKSYEQKMKDPNAYIDEMEQMLGKTFTDKEIAEQLSGDTEAGIAVLTSLINWPPLTDEDLKGITAPCFLYCGDQDPFYSGMQKSVELIPRARFLSMEGFNHITAFVQSEQILPYIHAFLKAVTK